MTEPTPIPAVAPTPTAPVAADPAPLITPDAPTPVDAIKAPVEPEKEVKYEFKAPKDYDTKEIEAFAKEAKLAPEVAQKILDREIAAKESFVKEQEAYIKNLSEKVWPAEIYNDPKLGGANIDKTRLSVMKAWQEIPKELRDEATSAGLHTHPWLVRILNHFGQMTKEDKLAGPPTNAAPSPKSNTGLVGLFADMK